LDIAKSAETFVKHAFVKLKLHNTQNPCFTPFDFSALCQFTLLVN